MLGGMAQLEPGPGQGGQHGVEVEVVACGGAGLAGGQPQVLLGVAEVEFDLETVAVDAINPPRLHLRVGAEQGGRLADLRGILVRVQDEDHLQQLLEGLVVQLRVVQPLALVRRLDDGQLADAGAVEAARVLARAARAPVGGSVQARTGRRRGAACSPGLRPRASSPLTIGSQA